MWKEKGKIISLLQTQQTQQCHTIQIKISLKYTVYIWQGPRGPVNFCLDFLNIDWCPARSHRSHPTVGQPDFIHSFIYLLIVNSLIQQQFTHRWISLNIGVFSIYILNNMCIYRDLWEKGALTIHLFTKRFIHKTFFT